MNDMYIRIALDTQLATSNLTIAYENTNFTMPDAGTWSRANLLPATTSVATLSQQGYNKYSGVYVVDVFGLIGEGTGAIMSDVSTIISLFNKTITLNYLTMCVSIISSSPQPAINDKKFYHVPVHIEYRAFAQLR